MSGITDGGILYETEPRMNAKDWERVEKELLEERNECENKN